MGDPRELRSRASGPNGPRRPRSKPVNLVSVTEDLTSDRCSPKASTNKLHQTMSVDASPDSKCPICLDRFENVAYLDHCWHRFCFRCVQEWSKNKAECPLCKQPFHSIVHSMRSEDDFRVYTVRPSDTDYFANPDRRRFRYRTTLTRERRTSVYPRRTSSARRTVSPPDNGILFEGLSGQTTRQRNAEMHQMIRRLASRRQASLEGRSMRQIQEQEIINFRRALYRSGTRVRSIEDGGRYRDISAEFFRRNPACLHRLVPWLKRELTVLFGTHGSLVNIVQHIIMSNVTRYDLESQAFADDLKPFLLHRTVHFLHEFISFARCPFNIEAYDQHANYDCPAPSYEEGSRSDSSIITISPDEADAQEQDHSSFTASTGQAPWDDETPGPSYSTSEQVRAALDTSESSDGEPSVNPTELQAQLPAGVEMNGDSCDSSDNCVIVGYVKPLAERTPELVELSSDSEESVGEKSEDVKNVQPIQFHSFSDTDGSGYASPFSVGSGDGSTSYKTSTSLSNKRRSKRREKDSSKTREPAPRSWLQSSPTKRDGDEDYGLSKRRKRDSSAQRSHSREHRSLKSKKKHRSMEKRKRKRDSSRHKRRKDKKRSRTRDKSLSRKSQTLSLSSESIESRELSRSRSHSNDYSKSRSKSKDSDYYLRNSYVRDGKYKWECTIYSQNSTRDGYESSYRRRIQSRAQYSRQSPSPNYRVQSFSERMNSRNPRGHQESRYCYYERHRSRSRSRSRSRTPLRGPERVRSEKPSGKRKYKTHHLESTHGGGEDASSAKDALEKPLSKYKKSESFSDRQTEAESQHKKRMQVSRSPSVEIIYEGKATETARRHKKKRKTEREPHKSHIDPSPFSSPVVITIDSDSDKNTEVQEHTEYESSISWSPTIAQNEREPRSPSSLLESQDCNYDRAEELESNYKDSIVTSTTGKAVKDETHGGSDNAVLVQPQGAANRHTLTSCGGGSTTVCGTSSCGGGSTTDSGTSSATGNQPSGVEADSSGYLFGAEEPLLLRLSRKFLEEENLFQLNSPEQDDV